jgi:long-subunit acyl-CoA synthetase (AMP-forming)
MEAMSLSTSRDRTGAAYAAPTVCAAFQATAERHHDRVALRTPGDELVFTWGEYRDRVARLAAGLAALGLAKGDTVGIQLTNRPEFHLLDMAAIHLGAIPFSVYNTSAPEQICERLENAESTIFVTEHAFLPGVRAAAETYGRIAHIIVVDSRAEGTLTLADVEDAGHDDFDFEAAWRSVAPEDVLTLIFTSGTTGAPKAAQLTHRNVMALLRNYDAVVPLPRENVISFMPMAHVAERAWSHYMPLAYGATATTCADREEVFRIVGDVRPDYLWLLPRMWQKLKEVVEGQVATMDAQRRDDVRAAIEVGLQALRAEQAREELSPELAAAREASRAALRQAVLVPLGLDRVVSTGIGGAPSPRSLVEFFNAIGLPMVEGYGLTETTGFGAIFSSPERFRIGSVGHPLPGVDARLAEDGELLLRSEMNMPGYRNQPEATREAIDEDGWFHTGDIAEIDEDGFVTIVDRKKDLIINSYGKNMSPVAIESVLRQECPLIAQVVAIGDGRAYNVALFTLEATATAAFLAERGYDSPEPWRDQRITDVLSQAVDRANARLSRVEQIKRFAVLPRDWAPDSEELTPTMKLKRKPIAQKYAAEIEALYTS